MEYDKVIILSQVSTEGEELDVSTERGTLAFVLWRMKEGQRGNKSWYLKIARKKTNWTWIRWLEIAHITQNLFTHGNEYIHRRKYTKTRVGCLMAILSHYEVKKWKNIMVRSSQSYKHVVDMRSTFFLFFFIHQCKTIGFREKSNRKWWNWQSVGLELTNYNVWADLRMRKILWDMRPACMMDKREEGPRGVNHHSS